MVLGSLHYECSKLLGGRLILPNIQIQKTGSRCCTKRDASLPASDLGRWMELAGVEAGTLLPSLAVKA